MGQGVSLSPDAQPEPVRDGLGATSHAAEALVQAVRRAASELPPGEVGSGIHLQDIMNDPSARAQAARWRSGGVAKKVGAAFARLVDSLHKLKPGWLDMSGVEPQPVDALYLFAKRRCPNVQHCQPGECHSDGCHEFLHGLVGRLCWAWLRWSFFPEPWPSW